MIRLNPVFWRELKQNSRTKKTVVMLVLFNILLALFGLFTFYLTFEGADKLGTTVKYSDILTIYSVVTGVDFLLVLFITPGITAGSICGEREKQTLDILLATKLSNRQIIIGKLMASIALLLLIAVSSLPVLALVFSIGGITFGNLMQFMVLIIVTSIFIGSIGILFSSICKRTTIATVGTYIVLLAIFFGLTMILLGGQAIGVISGIREEYISARVQQTAAVNDWYVLLIVNPLFSFASLLHDQIGILGGFFDEWNTKNALIYYIYQHWFLISMFVQLVISAICLRISAQIIGANKK